MNQPIEYLRTHRDRHIEELSDFIRIPSVSARSEHRKDIGAAADWLVERLLDAGMESAEAYETAGNPVVVSEWRGAPGAPTVLIYGHYDVQPPEPLDEWTSPPFEPTIRDGKLFGRGSVDDKGQLYLYVKAVEAHLSSRGHLPVNVVFMIEGEEEVGSPNLNAFLVEHRERLACDAVLISDTGMFAPGLPSITVGLRGLAYMEIRVRGARSDLHSGSYGGAVVNPANVLARIIAKLHDETGKAAIPGFYDGVIEPSDDDRRRIAMLPFQEEELRDEVGAPALGGEAGYSSLERLWVRPTVEVNGLLSGYTEEGAKTVLPAYAMAKVSMRLVPGQHHEDIERKFTEYVQSLAPEGVTVEVLNLHGGEPWYADPKHPIFESASRALERAFGRPPVFIREGGSIPIVEVFEKSLDTPVLLMGFALPGANTHAPDEWFSLENFALGSEAIAMLFDEVSTMKEVP